MPPYSRPYLFRSATNATSAPINFSKGNVKEGMVDSLSSRGLVKTLICLPSLLKRIVSTLTRLFSQSPTQRTPNTSHRKLYADDEDHAGDGFWPLMWNSISHLFIVWVYDFSKLSQNATYFYLGVHFKFVISLLIGDSVAYIFIFDFNNLFLKEVDLSSQNDHFISI